MPTYPSPWPYGPDDLPDWFDTNNLVTSEIFPEYPALGAPIVPIPFPLI